MATEIDPDFKIDLRLVDFCPPKTAVSELVQRPSYLINEAALTAAYMKDWQASRRPISTAQGEK